jgi:type IX secretion system PorP/SprF family membrane protein
MFVKRKLLYILLMSVLFHSIVGESIAQQVPIYSQYMFNKFILNPAVAGSEGYTAYNITSRVQWMGFKDAPVTNAISAQTRLIKSKFILRFNKKRVRYLAPQYGSVGLGVHLYNDHRGLLNQTGIQFTYAYHEKIELKEQLSFGLSLTFTKLSVSTEKMVSYSPDTYLSSGNLSVFIPDFNIGIYYTSPQTYLGFAISQLFQSAMHFGSYENNKFRLERNYNVMGGYRFPFNSNLSMEPSFQFKTTDQFFYQFDVGARLYYNKELWGGIFYRTGSALILTVGAKYKNLYFGYAYDFSFNSLQTYSFGTNELIISLKFAEFVRKYKWIERF